MAIRGITIFEFESLVSDVCGGNDNAVPSTVFTWLESECLRQSADDKTSWLKLTQRKGRRAVQVTSYVGVLRAPNGYQIEVLPKIGKVSNVSQTRKQLIEMLSCLYEFRHIQTKSAQLAATRMPLFEVFIREFLVATEHVVKRGIRRDYVLNQDNLFALRGKLMVSQQLNKNLLRPDRFFTEHDEFLPNRPENRLLHSALQRVLLLSISQENQRLARELCFIFSDVPESTQIRQDFQRVRLDRGMVYYDSALAWSKLILEDQSPLTGIGNSNATSLLFPMETIFEAYVEKNLARNLQAGFHLKPQASSHYLVEHMSNLWFKLKPDFLVKDKNKTYLILDAKWKLLDPKKNNGKEKYQLSQADFYQLYAYGQQYLDGSGDVVLIYPKTDTFFEPLPVFNFSKTENLKLWVLPYCIINKKLALPESEKIKSLFKS